jgi:hypothetical protein
LLVFGLAGCTIEPSAPDEVTTTDDEFWDHVGPEMPPGVSRRNAIDTAQGLCRRLDRGEPLEEILTEAMESTNRPDAGRILVALVTGAVVYYCSGHADQVEDLS